MPRRNGTVWAVFRERLSLLTEDNLQLEAELAVPDDAIAGAVLTHPHPRHGGNMSSMVPGELIVELPARNVVTLRFNFRGMGASQGAFEDGIGERLDIMAAVAALHEIVEGLPIVLCGSSFGADTALTVDDDRISAWCALAPPLRDHRLDAMRSVGESPRPKLLVVAERDQYRKPDAVLSVTSHWNATDMHVVPGADHFFVGRIEKAIAACVAFTLAQASAR